MSRPKQILFYDQDRKNQRDALRILSASGSQVTAPESLTKLETEYKKTKHNLYVLDLEGHQHLAGQGLLKDKPPVIILSKSGLKAIYPYLKGLPCISNFIAKDKHNRLSNRDLLGTVVKILDNDIFGMKKYLGWGAHTKEFQLRRSEGRQEYIECLKSFCQNMGLRRSIMESVQVVGEEFLMNAFYDAPIDENQNRLYNKLSRTEKVMLPPEDAINLQFGSDGKRLAISVADPFGSITREQIMYYLAKCFGGKDITNLGQDESTAGAGLGLYFCFNHVHSLIVNVSPLRRTEFIGIIDIDGSVKDAKHRKTNFHFFSTDNWSEQFMIESDQTNPKAS